jgi:hypothetical protein
LWYFVQILSHFTHVLVTAGVWKGFHFQILWWKPCIASWWVAYLNS